MKNSKFYYNRWLIQAPLGLILIGAGLCFLVESGTMKHDGAPFWNWFWAGTGSLIVINAGICIFGDSIVQRIRFENVQRNSVNQ